MPQTALTVFTHDELERVLEFSVDLGLSARRDALLIGVAPATISTLPVQTTPADQLQSDLEALNRFVAAPGVAHPLVLWLGNAHRAGGTDQAFEAFSDWQQEANRRLTAASTPSEAPRTGPAVSTSQNLRPTDRRWREILVATLLTITVATITGSMSAQLADGAFETADRRADPSIATLAALVVMAFLAATGLRRWAAALIKPRRAGALVVLCLAAAGYCWAQLQDLEQYRYLPFGTTRSAFAGDDLANDAAQLVEDFVKEEPDLAGEIGAVRGAHPKVLAEAGVVDASQLHTLWTHASELAVRRRVVRLHWMLTGWTSAAALLAALASLVANGKGTTADSAGHA